VLYVSEGWTPHDRRFLAAMSSRLGRTHWLRLGGGDGHAPDDLPRGVRAVRDRGAAPGEDAWTERIASAARETACDLVHAGPVPTAGLAAVRARAKPVVVMAWGSDVLLAAERGASTASRASEALRGAAGFVADARCVEEAARALGLPDATPRAVFPWGVEREALEDPGSGRALRARLGWEDAHVCVSLRAWKPEYRLDVLLDAFDAARGSDPRLRLALLGGGEDAPRVLARARPWIDAGVAACPGNVPAPELRAWLAASDLYVSSVPSDGSSVSLLEAMAAGRAAVVVGRHGNREWVEPGRTGWLVPPGDPAALAAALREAFRDPAALRRAGAAAREVVLARARWEENVGALFALYERVA
jgi:glycosyltransferase involved in cell wall biosynthesis